MPRSSAYIQRGISEIKKSVVDGSADIIRIDPPHRGRPARFRECECGFRELPVLQFALIEACKVWLLSRSHKIIDAGLRRRQHRNLAVDRSMRCMRFTRVLVG